MAKRAPDSRTPRRFMVISNRTITTANCASCPDRAGMAEAAYCAPEETDESASLAKTGRAIRFGRSVSPSCELRSLRPSSIRLETSPTLTRPQDTVSPVHVVIMGCGRVGSTLARSLEERNHTVSVIDSVPDSFRRLGPGFNGDKITGYGFDQEVLEKAGIRRADAFAAVSSGDNSNIIAARVARETFGIEQVVARIYDPGRAEVYQRLGITTVATVKWTADQVLRRLLPVGAEPDFRDPSGPIRVDQVPAPTPGCGGP